MSSATASATTTATPLTARGETPLPAAGAWMLAITRIAFGFYFLWAFLDKTFGLGYATPGENAWVSGGSPTTGYLSGVEGPLAGFYNGMAGMVVIDWLFMLGLLGIGVTLITGAGARVGALAGALMYLFMYGAAIPTVNNPFLDDHLTGALVLLTVAAIPAAWSTFGLGDWWARTAPSALR
ncbi:hypothetical protein [uncultured Serinicoccus sp.]|uniref:hypothetical protein n=1 Tax=uncultured Serinicoccus sp. TaxID=735514 RepID=UPI00260DA12C|nr:hypothetical protein [uncultured Serinicoccus sp.]